MAISSIRAELSADIADVWAVVTSADGTWRSDLREIVPTDDKHFAEIDRSGFETRFTVTAFEPCSLYELDIENENMTGHWTGKFTSANGRTIIEFTEDVTPKKALMKPFVKAFLKRRQTAYLRDLRKALEE
ncbi:MAG: SRPBCC family protein [Oscillospiraceae bacterium]|nr:SRPBCC family protein [Oscillospiraceae bacterium]